MPDIECCVNNLQTEAWRAVVTDDRVTQQHCLRRCGVCHDEPFLVVDGDVVVGDDHTTLLCNVASPGEETGDRGGDEP